MEKMFNLTDVALLMEEKGYTPGIWGDDEAWKPEVVLKLVDIKQDYDQHEDMGLLKVTFIDPRDDLFYRAMCYYDFDNSDPEWIGLTKSDGTVIDYAELSRRGEGLGPTDLISCTQVEEAEWVVKGWRPKP